MRQRTSMTYSTDRRTELPRAARRSLAALLDGIPWDFVGVLTTESPRPVETLLRAFRGRFLRRVAHVAQGPCSWFVVAEQTHTGQWHLHFLLGGAAHLQPRELQNHWRGHTHVTRYRRVRGSTAYLCKMVDQHHDTWDIGRRALERAGGSPETPAPVPAAATQATVPRRGTTSP